MQHVSIRRECRGDQAERFLITRLYEFLENQSSSGTVQIFASTACVETGVFFIEETPNSVKILNQCYGKDISPPSKSLQSFSTVSSIAEEPSTLFDL